MSCGTDQSSQLVTICLLLVLLQPFIHAYFNVIHFFQAHSLNSLLYRTPKAVQPVTVCLLSRPLQLPIHIYNIVSFVIFQDHCSHLNHYIWTWFSSFKTIYETLHCVNDQNISVSLLSLSLHPFIHIHDIVQLTLLSRPWHPRKPVDLCLFPFKIIFKRVQCIWPQNSSTNYFTANHTCNRLNEDRGLLYNTELGCNTHIDIGLVFQVLAQVPRCLDKRSDVGLDVWILVQCLDIGLGVGTLTQNTQILVLVSRHLSGCLVIVSGVWMHGY